MNLPVSLAVWLYLRSGQKVTSTIPETVFWTLVAKNVLTLSVEKSPVKAEGEILYVRKGPAFDSPLTPFEETFRIPLQTRLAERLKWKNYVPLVLRFLKSTEEIERKYILLELKEKGLLQRNLLDRLLGRKRVDLAPGPYDTYWEGKVEEAENYKVLYAHHFAEKQWDLV